MEFGFIFTFFLAQLIERIIPYSGIESLWALSAVFVLLGFFGGLIPDIDRLENIGFSHRKTLHYPIGYGLATILLIGIAYIIIDFSFIILGFSCIFAGAWLHSVMDLLNGFYENPNHGVYEHITRKWIKPLNWIPFASLWEWSLQSLGAVAFIAISPILSQLLSIPGWIITSTIYFIGWALSTGWEFRKTVPKRLEMEKQIQELISKGKVFT